MKIHFIGICGVAMGSLALAMKKQGHEVSGSDVGFYPPISTYLKKNKIDYYPGWHVEKMTKNSKPDLVIVGNVASSNNPEWLFVQKNKIKYFSYPELIENFFLKKNNIICAGTYGKTSTSALLAFILKKANFKPSYMFGGLAQNKKFLSAEINKGDYSVLEGDEYKTARWDEKAKFFHYHPTHLLLTALKWDHADIYKTEKDYFDAFQKLINDLPKDSLLILSENIKNNIKIPKIKIIKYGKNIKSDYFYTNLKQTKKSIKFEINFSKEKIKIDSPMLGDYMAENICACFAMAHSIGIDKKIIQKAIKEFAGLKRRMEKRLEAKITIIDDIAHSPVKASSVLKNLQKIYKGKIYAIFEPNTGNRKIASLPSYKNAFKNADEVIIAKLTQVKTDLNDPEPPFDGKKLSEIISSSHKNCHYIEDDNELINYLVKNTRKNDVVVFLGSHGFRGMIDELEKKIKKL
jgi:UDP-N-acetylmuramate: L-alanyl-gamma-D-glutamyl-meso-diaminopimelate ligase